MPFNIRNFDDENKAKMGCTECVTHKLIDPYPVLWDKVRFYKFVFEILIQFFEITLI